MTTATVTPIERHPLAGGPHDVGGAEGGPLDRHEHSYELWERQTHAVMLLLCRKGKLTVDELRRGVEALSEAATKNMTYYERWAASLVAICLERGTLTRAELDAQLGGEGQGQGLGEQATECPPTLFQAGNVVRVRPEHAGVRWRKPHLRTPGYLFGVVGTIERECQGCWPNPEALAFREPAVRQPLYRVRFSQADVWEGYSGDPGDSLDVEVYQPWLQPATQQELSQQQSDRQQRQQEVFSKAAEGEHHHHHHQHGEQHGHNHAHDHDHVHEARQEVEQAAVLKEEGEDGSGAARKQLATALLRALLAKGVVEAEEVRMQVELLDEKGTQAGGARIVARAWVDPEFRARLLQDASAAVTELGLSPSIYSATPKAGSASPSTADHPAQQAGALASSSQPSAGPGPSPPSSSSLGPISGVTGSRAGDTAHAPAPSTPAPAPPRSGTILTVVANSPERHNLVVCTLCSCYPLSILGMSPTWYKSREYRARAVREPRAVLAEFGTHLPPEMAVAVHDSTADNRYMVLPMRPEGTEGWSEERLQQLVSRDSMIGVTFALTPAQLAARQQATC
ncbi:hypothetical protein QJQ45_027975 [Haematococcus lacustris]|nr:hypothetical protein QJQ45_027975 [Haematococcus lacustris]